MTDAYVQAHAGTVIFDRSHCAKLEISGADHISFLHNILSQDISGMKKGEWRDAALLSATSHVLAYMHAVCLDNSVVLVSVPGSFEKIKGLLEKFIITEDVTIREASDWKFFEVWDGAKAPHFKLSKQELVGDIFKDENAREILRIENGLLEYGPDFNENFMLSETRLEKIAASDTKGCYPGQEVVAKIETYKRLNRSFVRFVFASELTAPLSFSSAQDAQPEVGSIIFDYESGEEIGRLTSRTFSPFYRKCFGLGWLKRGFFEKPIKVAIKSKASVAAETALFTG